MIELKGNEKVLDSRVGQTVILELAYEYFWIPIRN